MADVDSDWFADEAFWRETFQFMFPESRVSAAATEVEQILALAQVSGDNVLDLACGPGRHSVAFARRGLQATGVDRTPFLLDHARERAKREGARVEWVQSDMRSFVRPRSFDLAVCLFTSFGFFRDEADNQQVLTNVATSLRPGGAFVLDMLGKEILARIFNPTSSSEIPDGLLIRRHRVLPDWRQIENEWIVMRDGGTKTFRFRHWLYSSGEIKRMLEDAGFANVRLHGDYLGSPYGVGAPRLVVVGQTPQDS